MIESNGHVTEELLVADPAELRGIGDSHVARHVRECDECRAQAQLILTEQDRLRDALRTLSGTRRATHVERRRGRHFWIPAAAAAAAAVLLLVRMPLATNGVLPELPGPIVDVATAPKVNASSNDVVAVLQTRDPRITVVWYLQQER